MQKLLYILVVDKTWAKLYSTTYPPAKPTLVFHHALFGWTSFGEGTDDELAMSMCRMLRADRQSGKFQHLVMIASEGMLAALRRHYDGNWHDVTVGGVEDLPPHNSDRELALYVEHLMAQQALLLQQKAQEAQPALIANTESGRAD